MMFDPEIDFGSARLVRPAGMPRLDYRDRLSVRNDTGEPRLRFDAIGLADPVVTPDEDLVSFQGEPIVKGILPVNSSHTGHWDGLWGILLDDLAVDEIGVLLLTGVVPVSIDLTETWHPRADIIVGDSSRLRSYPGGAARILWVDRTSPGESWGLVRIGVAPILTYRGKLNQTLSPGGSAPMSLYYRGESSYSDEYVDVTVYAPPEMTSGTFAAAKWYRVAWEPQAFRLEIDTREC